jgi:hypothetical protein
MPTKQAAKTRRQPKEITRTLAAGTVTVGTLNYTTQVQIERPTTAGSIFTRCRYWAKESLFLKSFLPLKRSIYNSGLQIVPADPKDLDRLNKWLIAPIAIGVDSVIDKATGETVQIEPTMTNQDRVGKFVEDTWDEFFVMESATAIWLDDFEYATIVPIESCEYDDTLGVEKLRYTHGLTQDQVAQLPTDLQTRFKAFPIIPVNPAKGEHFRVVKRARVGDGYGTPGLYSIFRLLGEVESKEVGMHAMAFFMRRATRQHKVGHKIDSGERAGRNTHFWTQKRANAIKQSFENTIGPVDFTCNFDHEIVFPWPDPKTFDEVMCKGADHRLNMWAGPLAQMMVQGTVPPFLSQALESASTEDREKVGKFLEYVIFSAFKPPCPIKIEWSNLVFKEARLQSEMIKFGIQQGFISNATGAKFIGVDLGKESAQKQLEAADKNVVANTRPHWDTSHALAPSQGETAATLAEKSAAAKGATGPAVGSTPGNPPGTQHTS